ncbi:MAG: 50S ribosomal protein L3 [Kiritimatiellae bacterium]|jgi:large subunit ribosomal protein L3|nr:50S ribosomal protein L3 [Kiritimatiellia bacterium]
MQGLIGKKLGMTQIFDKDGARIAVTVVEAGPCPVIQKKTKDVDGYEAVQLGFDEMKESRVTKPMLGKFKKAGVAPCRFLAEFKMDEGEEVNEGDSVTTSIFEADIFLDVVGVTKGRGFQGVVKRHNMAGGRMTHGGHSKRRVGSIGQCSYPARVAKGQRMPGHMGASRVSQQNLKLAEIRAEDNLLLIKGSIPGANGSVVIVKKALKK